MMSEAGAGANANRPRASDRTSAKTYDVIIIRHPLSDGNAAVSQNLLKMDVATERPTGMNQIKELSANFMTNLTAAKPNIAAKLRRGKYFIHMSPLARAQ